MSNRTNSGLWDRFVQAAREGKVGGLWVRDDASGESYLFVDPPDPLVKVLATHVKRGLADWKPVLNGGMGNDHLCAHLRRWMGSKGYSCLLTQSSHINLSYRSEGIDPVDGSTQKYIECVNFDEGTELDQHLAAALWVIEQEQVSDGS